MNEPQKSSRLVIARADAVEEAGSTFREVRRTTEVELTWGSPREPSPGFGSLISLALMAAVFTLPLQCVPRVGDAAALMIAIAFLIALAAMTASRVLRRRAAPTRGTFALTFTDDLVLEGRCVRRERSDQVGEPSSFRQTLPRDEVVGADVDGPHLCLRLTGNRSNYLAMPWQTPAEREYVAGCVNAWQRREPLDTERVPHTRVAEPLDQVEEVERNDERRASLFVDE